MHMLQNGADCGGGRRMRTARLSRETCVVWPVAGCTRQPTRLYRAGYAYSAMVSMSVFCLVSDGAASISVTMVRLGSCVRRWLRLIQKRLQKLDTRPSGQMK